MKITRLKFLSPVSYLSAGYLIIILICACILALPFSSADGRFTSYLDSLFTATSAITTTGLIVVDTGTYYNLFGQAIITLLIQMGGLGYMLFVTLAFVTFRQKISVQSNLLLQESVKKPFKVDVIYFTKVIILSTIVIETIGAAVLSVLFYKNSPPGYSIYSGIFHSISTFNTAGFSIYKDSFCAFNSHTSMNITLIIVSTLGSLGFFVLYDTGKAFMERFKGIKNSKLSVHSRITLALTVVLLICGSVLIYFNENWTESFSLKQKILSSVFQASSASTTTGFNSVDTGKMSGSNLFVTILLMFIGAGSGGTAGGVKMTTFVVTLLAIYSIIRDRDSVNIFKRRITFETVRNSFAIVMLSFMWIFTATYIMTITENKEFLALLFEVTSAIGTVGLSAGITSNLSGIGKVIIILSMFIGRVGPLGIGLSLLTNREKPEYKYSTTDIFIG